MANATRTPLVWKYRIAAEQQQTRARLINGMSADPVSGCWNWTGLLNEGGYGLLGIDHHGAKFQVFVHRLSLHMSGRPVPKTLTVDHLCRNRKCFNPAHLDTVSGVENSLRGDGYMAVNARKTHCSQGHEFTAENTYTYASRTTGNPSRKCKACAMNQQRVRRMKASAAMTR